MIKLHRKVEYALIALKHLATQPRESLVSASEIVQIYKTPAELTARVLQVLARSGFVRSLPGLHGGYQLSSDLTVVTVHDLLVSMEGSTEIARCLLPDHGGCEVYSTCNIVQPVHVLNDRLQKFYQSIPIADLFGPLSEVQETAAPQPIAIAPMEQVHG